MSDLYLDPGTHDLYVSDAGVVRLTSGTLETVAQRLKIKLLTFKGEWFLDQNVGVPYFQQILGKNRDLTAIKAIFRAVLLADPDVDSVPRLDLELNSERQLSVVCDVVAIDRDLVVVGAPQPTVLISVSTESDPLIFFF